MRLSPLCLVPVGLAALVGCSDPVPPTPRGAWTVSFIDPGIDCQHMGHNTQVGDVTSNQKKAVVVDGTAGADISCAVRAAGSGFNVELKAFEKDKGLIVSVDGITAAATEEAPAPGILSYVSGTTVDAYNSSSEDPCNFYFIPNSGQNIAVGEVWFAFKCPAIVADQSTCEIQQGYALFENCSE